MVMQMSRSNQPLPQPQRRAPIQRPQVDDVGSRGRQLLILVLASLVGLIVWASTSQAAPSRTPADAGRAYLREGHYHLESGSNRTCEDLRCGTTLTQDACDACSLYRQTMSSENLQHVDFSGILIERGVALRATSRIPEIQAQLFARSFRFASPVDADQITADLTDGVLTVSIPKTGAGTHRIAVE
jgi:hypothetical protein